MTMAFLRCTRKGEFTGYICRGLDQTESKDIQTGLVGDEKLFSAVMDSAIDAIITANSAGNIVGWNKAAERIFGYSKPDIIDQPLTILMPERFHAPHKTSFIQIVNGGTAHIIGKVLELTGKQKNGAEFPLELTLAQWNNDSEQFFTAIIRDISERNHTDLNLLKVNRSLRTLRKINQALVHNTEEDTLISEVCHILTKVGGYRFVWVSYNEPDLPGHIRPIAYAGDDLTYLNQIVDHCSDKKYHSRPDEATIRTGSPTIINNIATNIDYRSLIALPLYSDEQCFGAINLCSVEANAFDDEATSLLMDMASDLAFGIANLRRELSAAEHEKQMQALIDHNPDAIFILDAEGNIQFANPSAEVLLGQSVKHLQGSPFGLPMIQGETTEIEVLSRHGNGNTESRKIELRLLDISTKEGNKTLAFLHDITERHKVDQLSKRMGRILEHSWNEIYVFSAETLKFLDVSTGGQRQLGYTLNELQQMTPHDIVPEFNLSQLETHFEPLREGEKQEIQFETEQRRKNGSVYPVEVRLQLSKEEFPAVFIAIVQDISERKNYIAELEHKALYDALTDLPNRVLLQDRLDQALKTARRDEIPLTVITITFLRLNEINDLMGYQCGDQVLEKVVGRLIKLCRQSDTVARLGDNEFVIVLLGANLESSLITIEKIQKMLESPVNIPEFSLEIEAAFGIALYPEHGDKTITLLQRSDIAMRMAKYEGTGKMAYSCDAGPFNLKQLRLHGELRQALNDSALSIYYQPKVDIKTGCIVGVEALARWPHPREGMIPPDNFIPMIEQSGLIRPFTQWVLEVSISQLRHWKEVGLDISIAINLSTRNLLDLGLPKTIAKIIKKNQVNASNLYLEITESALMSHPEQALNVLIQLHEMGIKLSIDDFGTGYSSLSYLKKLPVDELKIDRSFVAELANNDNDRVIVRSTIDLAHNLGLRTVAEGTENEEILDTLKIMNCDIAQGYYLSRPIPVEELQLWLTNSPWGLSGIDKNGGFQS